MTQSQLGVFEFGNPKTQENCVFSCKVKPIQDGLSSSAPEFISKHLSETSEKSVTSDGAESLCEENSEEELSNTQGFEYTQSYRDLFSSDSEEENISNLEVISCSEEIPQSFSELTSEYDHLRNFNDISDQDSNHVSLKEEFSNTKTLISQVFELPEPRFTREEKGKWVESNKSSVTVIAGNSMRRDPQKKSKKRKHVSTWYVDSGCSRHMTGTLELLSHYVNKEGSSVASGGNQKGKIKGYGMIVK
ncbi:hypothetical protein OSB04_017039 [Centaurea solstitialis]|uniref:Retrovirus-related Pol polyprotein from transposon TNT 1-94-like beta-barrel domain-containing protein n=1 Tax=Centaurea solstitialis TaxID=347529 RepID=A0AA38WKC5_9ASTR|nr:hypothetical protein OSB04_017039 [Centaurea solstitialis]